MSKIKSMYIIVRIYMLGLYVSDATVKLVHILMNLNAYIHDK
jgi:hypothetical protein